MSTLPFLASYLSPLFGYIDPFMGSVLLQVVAAGFLGVVIFFKRARLFVTGLFCGKQEASSTETADHDIDE
ncbi:MAG: hypothetical protein Q4G59_03825 [Planctomycetia bacterium]|nr:hypothetical protein [Planctomycetia bacterium]